MASLAFACTVPEGGTFFSDGSTSKQVARGARITAYAIQARPNQRYVLVVGSNGDHPTHACMVTNAVVNPSTRVAGSDGYIGRTSGPAGNTGMAAGVYQLCFRDAVGNDFATAAATLTLT